MSLSENVELHLHRVIEEHITTLLNYPTNLYQAVLGSNSGSDQEGRLLRLKTATSEQIEALEKLSRLIGELHIASVLRTDDH